MKKRHVGTLIICLLCCVCLLAAEKVDSEIQWRIRREATENSRIMDLVHQLADVYGPRLTGTRNFKAACDWALQQMKTWGMQNERLEKWDFEHPFWDCDHYSVRVLSPYRAVLDARVIAWTPATNGPVRAGVVQIQLPSHPSQQALEAYLDSVKHRIKGRIVFVGNHTKIPVQFNPTNKRRDESDLLAMYDPMAPEAATPAKAQAQRNDQDKILEPRQVEQMVDIFLVEGGALAKVVDSGRPHGQIGMAVNRTYNASKAVPGVVIRNEDYGRLSRLLASGAQVEMEIEIQSTIDPEDQFGWNVVAEIPGTDKKEQVVLMGAHLDSWHVGSGATDNATGVAVMMEAARILQTLHVKPRRTIRVALWGGEEQGLLGSKAYVRDHFGTFEAPKGEFFNLSAYLNLDSGTGRIRGATVFGPSEAAQVLRSALAGFTDTGVVGVNHTKVRSYGGTDSTSFSWAGLPNVNFSQDPIEYVTHTWHTNLDTYERVLEADLKQCAMVVAATAYHLAMSEDLLPRFSPDMMPSPEK